MYLVANENFSKIKHYMYTVSRSIKSSLLYIDIYVYMYIYTGWAAN